MKRPSSHSHNAQMKRPATGSKETMASMIKDLEDEHAEGEEDCGGDCEDKRDKGKAEKFMKLYRSNQLPAEVVYMWDIESRKAPSERKFKTNLVNNLFSRLDDGTFKICTDSNQFKQWRRVYERHLATDKKTSMPEGVMLHSHFHGDRSAMEASLQRGELESWKDAESGVTFVAFRKLSVSKEKVNERGENVEGSKKLTGEQADTLAGLMAKLKWSWNCNKVFKLHNCSPSLRTLNFFVKYSNHCSLKSKGSSHTLLKSHVIITGTGLWWATPIHMFYRLAIVYVGTSSPRLFHKNT